MSRLLVSMRFAPYSETEKLAVRHAADIIEADGIFRESFGPNCWIDGGHNAEISVGHDTPALGRVVALASHGGWWYADVEIETDDPEQLALIKAGQDVSLGARSIQRDPDHGIGVRRHRRCLLEHIAIARRGEVGAITGAKITRVVEAKPKTAVAARTSGQDWRKLLPRGYEDFADAPIDLQPGDELLIAPRTRGAKWDGQRFHLAGGALALA